MSNSKRIDYFDFLRGVAILMVIGIHTYTIRSFDGWDSVALIGIREVLNFAVPLFLAISGFFIGRKSLSDKNSYFAFLKKQIPRVYIPALIWSLPMLVLWIYKGQGIVLSIGKVLGCMTFGPYYFVVLIIQFYLLHPLIKRMAAKPAVGGGILVVINTLCVYFLVYKLGKESLPATVSVGPFVYWVIFYFIGVCLSDKKRNYSLLWPVILIVVGFVAQFFEAKYLMSLGSQGVGLKISSWVYSAGMILLLFSSKTELLLTKDNLAYRLMVKLGTISFGVYLIHMYFVLAESALIRFDGWLMSFVVVAVLTIGFVIVLRKVIPSKYWKLLGII